MHRLEVVGTNHPGSHNWQSEMAFCKLLFPVQLLQPTPGVLYSPFGQLVGAGVGALVGVAVIPHLDAFGSELCPSGQFRQAICAGSC